MHKLRENAAVFEEHFDKLFSGEPEYEEKVLEMLNQLTPAKGIDSPPTEEEIYVIKTLRNTGPGESGISVGRYTNASLVPRNLSLGSNRRCCISRKRDISFRMGDRYTKDTAKER